MGAKKFVLFGSCGVLDDGKVKDRIIIPVAALRDEGTELSLPCRRAGNPGSASFHPSGGACFSKPGLFLY